MATFYTISEALSEEIVAVNAIYGEETVSIIQASDKRTTAVLRIPCIHVGFYVFFPGDYPISAPELGDADLPLHRARSRHIQNIRILLSLTLEDVFKSDSVCLFDLLENSVSVLNEFDVVSSQFGSSIDEVPYEWRWITKPNIDPASQMAEATCAICLEDDRAFKMVELPCQHYFCYMCFQNGWESASSHLEEYSCCGERIPNELIKQSATTTSEQSVRYAYLLRRIDTAHPFYCGHAGCEQLIGSSDDFLRHRGYLVKRNVDCQKCNRKTCAKCGKIEHIGRCSDENFLKALMKLMDIRRCPNCRHGIEKNGGCPHMHCTGCNRHWWWTEEGTMIPYETVFR